MIQILHVTEVRTLPEYRLQVAFNNGVAGIVDLSSELNGQVFESLRDPARFEQARVGYGTVVWPEDIDLAPEYLHQKLVEQGGVSNSAAAPASP